MDCECRWNYDEISARLIDRATHLVGVWVLWGSARPDSRNVHERSLQHEHLCQRAIVA
jgi:hypothetical protein